MPQLALIVVIAISLFLPAQRELPSVVGARTFVSPEGRFSISLPSLTGFGPLNIPTPFANAKGDLFEWETKEATFGVGYADAAQALDQPGLAKLFFDSAVERFNKVAVSNSGSIAAVKQITLGKYPGIEQRVDLFTGSVIQRTYIASRRIYEIVAVVNNSQRAHEGLAIRALDSFKILDQPEVKVAKVESSPLPQTPVTARDGSDASDEGLHDHVKSVLTETVVATGPAQQRKPQYLNTYNKQGNLVRSEWHDDRGNVSTIKLYGYIDGSRVSKVEDVDQGSDPADIKVSRPADGRKFDPRFQYRYEYKYDEKKRLIEESTFLNDRRLSIRDVYKYDGNQKEKLTYSGDGRLSQRVISKLDDKGNVVEETVFYGQVARYKTTYVYEFDAKGNWTKRTTSTIKIEDGHEQSLAPEILFRTIKYQ